jgi:CheY-like chemotaxis protein
MSGEPAVECPQCGHNNDTGAQKCAKCGLDLEWALEEWDQHVTGPEASHPPLILVVNDEPAALMLFEIILDRAGYRVAKARDAFEALDLTRRLVPNLIITDDMMPGMRGLEMIAHLKADPVLKGVPVIMLSTRAGIESVNAAMEAGALCFLPMPILPHDLWTAVASVLAGDGLPLVLFAYVKQSRELGDALVEKGYRVLELYLPEATARGAKLLKSGVIAIGFHSSIRAGLALLAQLKADDEVSGIPVVMLAAETSPLARRFIRWRAAVLGAQAVYSGPLDAENLAGVFQAALEES